MKILDLANRFLGSAPKHVLLMHFCSHGGNGLGCGCAPQSSQIFLTLEPGRRPPSPKPLQSFACHFS